MALGATASAHARTELPLVRNGSLLALLSARPAWEVERGARGDQRTCSPTILGGNLALCLPTVTAARGASSPCFCLSVAWLEQSVLLK